MGNMFKTDFQDSVCEVTSSSGAKLETDAIAQLAFRASKIWQNGMRRKRDIAQQIAHLNHAGIESKPLSPPVIIPQ